MPPDSIYSRKFSSKKQRGSLWYIIVFSIVIGLVIRGFLTKQYGMSFIILLIVGLTYFVENNSEDIVEVKITELGIKVGEVFYDFPRINFYTIIYSGENAIMLRLDLKKKGLRNIDLMVDNDIVSNIKNILPKFIEENPKQDLSFTDKVINILKL